MVKLVVLPVLIVLLAMHTPINAFGIVRVDVQKDYGLANAIGSAISSKIQSWNSILNSLLQAKASYGGTYTVRTTTSGNSGTGTANLVPLYQKTVHVNSGYATAPSSGSVATRIDTDDDNEVAPAKTASQGSVATSGQTLVTVNKSFVGIPAVSVSTSGSAAPVASGSASVAASASVPSTVAYSYRKGFVSV